MGMAAPAGAPTQLSRARRRLQRHKNRKADAAIRAVAVEVKVRGGGCGGDSLGGAITVTEEMGNLGPLSVVAFCFWAIAQKARAEEVEAFFKAIDLGRGLDMGDPILQARHMLQGERYDRKKCAGPNVYAEIILRAWINHRKGVTSKIKITGKLPILDDLAVIQVAEAA